MVVCREEGACCLDCEGQGEEEDEVENEQRKPSPLVTSTLAKEKKVT